MWWRRRALKGLDEDIRDHIARETEEHVARGMAPQEARRQALVKFGNVRLAKEDTRAVWAWHWVDSIRADLRYALRGLLKHPGYTSIAGITLIVALGLTSSVFTVYNSLFFRPWPVPEPHRVFALTLVAREGQSDEGMPGASPSYAEYGAIAGQVTRAEILAWLNVRLQVRTSSAGSAEPAQGLAVTPEYFDVLQVPLQLGRGLSSSAINPGPTAVISDGFWHAMLGGAPDVIGRVIFINDTATTIVGVAPPFFRGTHQAATDLYVPFPGPGAWARTLREWWGPAAGSAEAVQVAIAGRLRPAWSLEEAQSELGALHRLAAANLPSERTPKWIQTLGQREVRLTSTAPGQRPGELPGNVRTVFALLFAASGLVLILACANLGHLQLARNLARSREFRTRLALGASRSRIIRQLLTEALLLASAATAGGVLVAWWLPLVVITRGEGGREALSINLGPDLTVLAVAGLLCVLTSVGYSLLPALHVTRRQSQSGALVSSRHMPAGTRLARGVVLGLQVAISTVLLVGAMLLTRAVLGVADGLGFAAREVSAGRITLPAGADASARHVALQRIHAALDSAGFAHVARFQVLLPLEGPGRLADLVAPPSGQPQPRGVAMHVVSSNYFEALDIPLIAGRRFNDATSSEAVVNESALGLLPPGSGPGTAILVNKDMLSVVGVVRDAKLLSATRVYPMVFRGSGGEPLAGVIVRDPRPNAAPQVDAIVRGASLGAQARMIPISRLVAERTRSTRVGAALATAIAGLALLLASVGVFGVFGYMVEERRREIGIRLALGARKSHVALGALRTMRLATLLGLAAGLGLAVAAGRLLRGYLYGLSPLDPLSFLGVLGILAASAFVATVIPARRAARVNPVEALKAE